MRAIAVLCAVLSLSAADRPNFTGDWKMNPDKSSFGQLPRPLEYERTIKHKDPIIHMSVRQVTSAVDQTFDMTLRTDGRETRNQIGKGESRTTGKWVGRDLQFTTSRGFEEGDVVSKETWSLSGDGKILTSVTVMQTPRGTVEVRMVLDKQ